MSRIWPLIRDIEVLAAACLLSLVGGIGLHDAITVSMIALVLYLVLEDLKKPDMSLGGRLKTSILGAGLGIAVALSTRLPLPTSIILVVVAFLVHQLAIIVPKLINMYDPNSELRPKPKDCIIIVR